MPEISKTEPKKSEPPKNDLPAVPAPAPTETEPRISPAQQAVLQSAAALAKPEKPGRIFRTTGEGGRVGPFIHRRAIIGSGTELKPQFPAVPYVFSEAEFVRKHPIPDSPAAKATIDPETYHHQLLQRLLDIGAIEEAPGATPTESAPETLQSAKNPGIASSTKNILAHRAQVDRQRKADLQRVNEAQAK